MENKVRFISGYRGEFEYYVQGYGQRRFAVRDFATDDGHYNTGAFEEVRLFVGCLYCPLIGLSEFPPQEVSLLFPGYVRAKCTWNPFRVVYDGEPPVLVFHKLYGWTTQLIIDKRCFS